MENTHISWATHTFNPWIGCEKVSAGCANCYAEQLMDKRFGRVQWGANGTRSRTSKAEWAKPLKWNREAAGTGVRPRVFCASLADVFEDREELIPWRYDLFALIAGTPNLDWLLLTKRPENVLGMVPEAWAGGWPRNVWLGVSVENQAAADERIPLLLQCPATVRFLSCEPLLGPVDLDLPRCDTHDREYISADGRFCTECAADGWSGELSVGYWLDTDDGIDWVIVGGESGPNARPMHPDWARGLRDQCAAAGVPFHFKQWGEWCPGLAEEVRWIDMQNGKSQATDKDTRYDDHGVAFQRVGKLVAGRLLDGVEHNGLPEVRA